MKIYPLIGFDDIQFGNTRTQVQDILGDPSFSEIIEFPDGDSTDSWIYENSGIELNFDSEEKFRLTRITFSAENAQFEGVCVIGKSEKELLQKFPQLFLDESADEFGKSYEYPEKEASFWFVNGEVANFTLFVPFDDSGKNIIWPK